MNNENCNQEENCNENTYTKKIDFELWCASARFDTLKSLETTANLCLELFNEANLNLTEDNLRKSIIYSEIGVIACAYRERMIKIFDDLEKEIKSNSNEENEEEEE